jgi:hypothetical protein
MVEVGKNWKCPYCGHAQVIGEERYSFHLKSFDLDGLAEQGKVGYFAEAIACANSDCRSLKLNFGIVKSENTPWKPPVRRVLFSAVGGFSRPRLPSRSLTTFRSRCAMTTRKHALFAI